MSAVSALLILLFCMPVWGDSKAAIAISPGGGSEEVSTVGMCPTFSWTTAKDAGGYELVVYKVKGRQDVLNAPPHLRISLPVGATSWTPSYVQCPEPGFLFAWAVAALKKDNSKIWSNVELFRVASYPTDGEVNRALQVLERFLSKKDSEEFREMLPDSELREPIQEKSREDVLFSRRTERRCDWIHRPVHSEREEVVSPPNTISLSIDGHFDIGGFIFKQGSAFLHDDGFKNTALGLGALANNDNSVGFANTAMGANALEENTLGTANTAVGSDALAANTGGKSNTAVGDRALSSNTDGLDNTAVGASALQENTLGNRNTAVGGTALNANTGGSNNVAIGLSALATNTTGNLNVGLGNGTLLNNQQGSGNVAVGDSALGSATGSGNIALGAAAGRDNGTGDDNIYIGNPGADESDTIRIGTGGVQTNVFIPAIAGSVVSGATVVVNGDGEVGVAASSQRSKENVQELRGESRHLLKLRPVLFRYKGQANRQEYGLIAEEVAEALPRLVKHDNEGRPFAVHYRLLTVLLVEALQNQHHEIQNLKESLRLLQRRGARKTAP